MRLWLMLICVLPTTAMGDILVAARTLRSQTLLTPEHVTLVEGTVPGALSHPAQAIGQEARVVLYAGRPIRPEDIGPPAIIDRNEIVILRFQSGTLSIATEARALGRAGVGDRLRVMNLASRTTVSGTVSETGEVVVGNQIQP